MISEKLLWLCESVLVRLIDRPAGTLAGALRLFLTVLLEDEAVNGTLVSWRESELCSLYAASAAFREGWLRFLQYTLGI